jgi:hypothetical protein
LRYLYQEYSSNYNGYHGGNPFATGQLKLVQVGNDTQVQGWAATAATSRPSSVLKNVTASSLTSANFVGDWNPDGSAIAGKVVTSGPDLGYLAGGRRLQRHNYRQQL